MGQTKAMDTPSLKNKTCTHTHTPTPNPTWTHKDKNRGGVCLSSPFFCSHLLDEVLPLPLQLGQPLLARHRLVMFGKEVLSSVGGWGERGGWGRGGKRVTTRATCPFLLTSSPLPLPSTPLYPPLLSSSARTWMRKRSEAPCVGLTASALVCFSVVRGRPQWDVCGCGCGCYSPGPVTPCSPPNPNPPHTHTQNKTKDTKKQRKEKGNSRPVLGHDLDLDAVRRAGFQDALFSCFVLWWCGRGRGSARESAQNIMHIHHYRPIHPPIPTSPEHHHHPHILKEEMKARHGLLPGSASPGTAWAASSSP